MLAGYLYQYLQAIPVMFNLIILEQPAKGNHMLIGRAYALLNQL